MISFLTNIFPLWFSSYDKRNDTDKDINGKGKLERYNEVIGEDLDTGLVPLIEELLPNVLSPVTCYDRFVPFLESEIGYNPDTQTLKLSNAMIMRRALLKILPKLSNVKGTIIAWNTLFAMIGFTSVEIEEYFNDFGFDSSITLDDAVRRFDSGCPQCIDISIRLTGEADTLSPQIISAIASIIRYNKPIDVNVRDISYNDGAIVVVPGDFSNDFNDDYYLV